MTNDITHDTPIDTTEPQPALAQATVADGAQIIPFHADPRPDSRRRPAGLGDQLGTVSSLTDRLSGSGGPTELVDGVRRTLAKQVTGAASFLRRRLGGDYTIDEFGYDEHLSTSVLLPALRPTFEKWFRVEVSGIENLPLTGAALVVANHAGVLPIDGLMTQVAVHDHHPNQRALRMLAADLVFETPFLGTAARKAGHTLACTADAERLLRSGELTAVFPEGFKGVGKQFADRYKLQRFGRGGFVSAALRTQVPIIPLSVVGAEEIYPLVANLPSLARVLGVPYIPITPLFPLLGPLGLVPLPSKWLLEFGEPIRTDEFDVGAADDPMLVFNVTDQVRETIQSTLYSLLMQRQSVFR